MPPMIEQDTDKTMRQIADEIQARCGHNYGFAVLVFGFTEDDIEPVIAHYISNAERPEMIAALREHADILEQHLDIQAEGERQ